MEGHFAGREKQHAATRAHSSSCVPYSQNILFNLKDTASQEKFGDLRDDNCNEDQCAIVARH